MTLTQHVGPKTGAVLIAGVVVIAALGIQKPIETAKEVIHITADRGDSELMLDGVPSFRRLTDGSRLNLDLTTPPDATHVDGRLWLDLSPSDPQSIIFVIDGSNSTYDPAFPGCGGDYNGDSLSSMVSDCEFSSVAETLRTLDTLNIDAQIGLEIFSGSAATLDVSPDANFQSWTTATADLNGDGEVDLETVLRSIEYKVFPKVHQFTYTTVTPRTVFSPAVQEACDVMATAPHANRTVVFLSDGENIGGAAISTVLPCSEPVTFHAVAVGAGSSCNYAPGNIANLQDISEQGGGNCFHAEDPSELANVLISALVPSITKLELSVDGGARTDITHTITSPLPHLGSGELQFGIDTDVPVDVRDVTYCFTATAGIGDDTQEVTECVTKTLNNAPIAVAGNDLFITEGDWLTLDGSYSVDPEGDSLTYQWSLLTLDGPPLVVPSAVLPVTTFQSLDDGVYVFELEVSDGLGTQTDTVQVTVTNADPVLSVVAPGGTQGGPTLLTAQFTDIGILDTHTATIDWGEGSGPVDVPVSAQGTGWGAFFSSHIYANDGTYPVVITLTDDDGATDRHALDLYIKPTVALFANGTDDNAVEWEGDGVADGWVHSNGGILFHSGTKTVDGDLEYVTIDDLCCYAGDCAGVLPPVPAANGGVQ
ncbi:MAG: hypothetical protein GWP91_23500 [Rhodobacterales bacterium]|nr:hypothetical protein [Rhodobacterales bacterium]